MSRHYFTFGTGQEFAGRFYVIEADTADQARHRMMQTFSTRWSFQYTEEQFLPLLDGYLSHYSELTDEELQNARQAKEKVHTESAQALPIILAKLPKLITTEQAHAIIETRLPLGKFIHPDNGVYVGIDNETGDAWTEEFETFKEALKWHKEN